MAPTQHSLLRRAKDCSETAWDELTRLYHPLIQRWLNRNGLSEHDSEETAQDIMQVVVQRLPDFEHSGRPGAFRKWLRVITANQTKAFWRQRQLRPQATGGSLSLDLVASLEDQDSALTKAWNEEHDQYILSCLLEKTLGSVSTETATTFRKLVLEERQVEEVAAEMELTVGAVYSVKSRVLRRLRQEAEGMIDDHYFC